MNTQPTKDNQAVDPTENVVNQVAPDGVAESTDTALVDQVTSDVKAELLSNIPQGDEGYYSPLTADQLAWIAEEDEEKNERIEKEEIEKEEAEKELAELKEERAQLKAEYETLEEAWKTMGTRPKGSIAGLIWSKGGKGKLYEDTASRAKEVFDTLTKLATKITRMEFKVEKMGRNIEKLKDIKKRSYNIHVERFVKDKISDKAKEISIDKLKKGIASQDYTIDDLLKNKRSNVLGETVMRDLLLVGKDSSSPRIAQLAGDLADVINTRNYYNGYVSPHAMWCEDVDYSLNTYSLVHNDLPPEALGISPFEDLDRYGNIITKFAEELVKRSHQYTGEMPKQTNQVVQGLFIGNLVMIDPDNLSGPWAAKPEVLDGFDCNKLPTLPIARKTFMESSTPLEFFRKLILRSVYPGKMTGHDLSTNNMAKIHQAFLAAAESFRGELSDEEVEAIKARINQDK